MNTMPLTRAPARKPKRARHVHRDRLVHRGLDWDGDKPVKVDRYQCAICRRMREDRRDAAWVRG